MFSSDRFGGPSDFRDNAGVNVLRFCKCGAKLGEEVVRRIGISREDEQPSVAVISRGWPSSPQSRAIRCWSFGVHPLASTRLHFGDEAVDDDLVGRQLLLPCLMSISPRSILDLLWPDREVAEIISSSANCLQDRDLQSRHLPPWSLRAVQSLRACWLMVPDSSRVPAVLAEGIAPKLPARLVSRIEWSFKA